MATPAEELSSTSSSKAEKFATGDPAHIPPAPAAPAHTRLQERRGFPWAFVLAICIVIGVEIFIRATGWPKKIPYQLGMDEYHAAGAQIDRYGPAQVAIVGSSRTRESIDVPVLKRTLEQSLGRSVTVANYAASGARTADFEAITTRLLHDKHPPKLIIIGISERDLANEPGTFDRISMYWKLDDFKEVWGRSPSIAIDNLSTMFRHELADHWMTLRYRNQLRLRLQMMLTNSPQFSSPAAGANSPWQREQQRRTLKSFPVADSEIKKYLHDMQLKHYPDPDLRAALDRLCRKCKASHVQLIIYELPIAHVMQRNLPPGLYDRYIREVKRIANSNGVRFVRLDSLKLKLSDADFREPSHMGGKGAKRFTKALGSRVIGPALKAHQAGPSGPGKTAPSTATTRP